MLAVASLRTPTSGKRTADAVDTPPGLVTKSKPKLDERRCTIPIILNNMLLCCKRLCNSLRFME
eukprot:1402594-Amphidinium_carterae.1